MVPLVCGVAALPGSPHLLAFLFLRKVKLLVQSCLILHPTWHPYKRVRKADGTFWGSWFPLSYRAEMQIL
jgi:hypothetical protein